jgi:hypothetical protein
MASISTFVDVTQAQAQAYWAAEWREHQTVVAQNQALAAASANTTRNIIAGLQQAASFYFADKQYDIQNRNLDRLNLITTEQLTHSGKLRAQWEYGIACENKQTSDACDTSVPKPNYQLIQSRIRAQVAPAFAVARRNAKRRYGVHCRAAMCAELRDIDIKEAFAISASTEAAYRKDEGLYEIRLATKLTHRMNVLQHNRGMGVVGAKLLEGAATSAKYATGINPYYGFSQAVNSAAGYWDSKFALDDVRQRSGFNSGMIRPASSQLGQIPSGATLSYQDELNINASADRWDWDKADRSVDGDIGVIGNGDQAFGAGAGNSEPTVDPFTQNGWGT